MWILLLFLAIVPVAAQSIGWNEALQEAEVLYRNGDIRAATVAARKTLTLANTPEEKGRSYDRLGLFLEQEGSPDEGEQMLLHARDILIGLNPESRYYADLLLNFGIFYRDRRELDKALKFSQDGIKLLSKTIGKSNAEYADALTTLATIHHLRNELREAEAIYDEAAQVYQKLYNPKEFSPGYGSLLINYAQLPLLQGNYQKATDLFKKGIALLCDASAPKNVFCDLALGNAGALAQELGHYDEAEKLDSQVLGHLREAQQIRSDSDFVGVLLNNRGVVRQRLRNAAAAEADLREAIAVHRKTGHNFELAISLRNLGDVKATVDRIGALAQYKEAITLFEREKSVPYREIANTLLSLGRLQIASGQTIQAAETLNRARDLAALKFNAGHPLRSSILLELAHLSDAQGQTAIAIQQYQTAIESTKSSKGDGHPELIAPYVALAGALKRTGNFLEAGRSYRLASAIQGEVENQVLAVGSETAKTEMLSSVSEMTQRLLEFQAEATSLPTSRELAFEAVARRKGRVLEFVRNLFKGLEEAPLSSVAPVLKEWKAVNECEVSLTLALGYRDIPRPVSGGCAYADEYLRPYEVLGRKIRKEWSEEDALAVRTGIETLRAKRAQLEERLSMQSGEFRQRKYTSVDKIRAALQPDEILIEFVRHDPDTGSRYGAFLVEGQGPIQWLDLGGAKRIDQAVTDLLRVASEWSGASSHGRPELASALQGSASTIMARLSEGPFSALSTELAKRQHLRRIRIAPDGMLMLLPFEAITVQGKTVLERYSVGYLLTGRELESPHESADNLRKPVIAVSPGGRIHLATTGALPFRADMLKPLPKAKHEANNLLILMPRARLLGERQASEEALKLVEQPSILTIIGHAVVRGKNLPTFLNSNADVMDLSSIVLEEAYGRAPGSSEDGFLTAQELRNLNLSGTEMLVLSQCSLADGFASVGEGTYGMRRAASLAGVQTFVAPLWPIEDTAENTLMTHFFRELRGGLDRAAALQKAKLQVRSNPATRHFLYWAPMILSGEIRRLEASVFTTN